MKRAILVLILLLLAVPAPCLAVEETGAGVVNHVMAAKFDPVPGKGFLVNGPTHIRFVNPAGVERAVSGFATLDQLVFGNGTHKVDLKVVEDATGAIIAEASHNSVTVQGGRVVQSYVTDWNLNAKAGLYTYQVIVNNAVIAAFKIDIATAK